MIEPTGVSFEFHTTCSKPSSLITLGPALTGWDTWIDEVGDMDGDLMGIDGVKIGRWDVSMMGHVGKGKGKGEDKKREGEARRIEENERHGRWKSRVVVRQAS
jgi:hypothetical protein